MEPVQQKNASLSRNNLCNALTQPVASFNISAAQLNTHTMKLIQVLLTGLLGISRAWTTNDQGDDNNAPTDNNVNGLLSNTTVAETCGTNHDNNDNDVLAENDVDSLLSAGPHAEWIYALHWMMYVVDVRNQVVAVRVIR